MSPFRTEVLVNPSDIRISHRSKILMLGSCFTENIGTRLQKYKFNIDINPMGILYNPLSILKCLEVLLTEQRYKKSDLDFGGGKWFSYDHHSEFSDPVAEKCLEKINNRLSESSKILEQVNVIFLTFGTAWSYLLLGTDRVVSNCHKQPAAIFDRFRLTTNQISDAYYQLVQKLLDANPDLRIIFSVSPIRYWKDGPVDNSLSKSTVIVAIHRIIKEFTCCSYFPAYEIAMDDLRDYRFYADDMLHPNNQMIEYIWNKFGQAYFDSDTIKINAELSKVLAAAGHKPFSPGSLEHQKFLKTQLGKILILREKYPFLDFSADEKFFSDQLVK
jgi:hypothetical protein